MRCRISNIDTLNDKVQGIHMVRFIFARAGNLFFSHILLVNDTYQIQMLINTMCVLYTIYTLFRTNKTKKQKLCVPLHESMKNKNKRS